MIKVNKLILIGDILNSEGTILGLYQMDTEFILGSFLTDKKGMVYYSTTKEILNQYLNSEITLKQVYINSKDFLVSYRINDDMITYMKEDFTQKIQYGDQFYDQLSDGVKNSKIQKIINGS